MGEPVGDIAEDDVGIAAVSWGGGGGGGGEGGGGVGGGDCMLPELESTKESGYVLDEVGVLGD